MPSTRGLCCPGRDRAAPTLAAWKGSAGCVVTSARSARTHLWNFMTSPCNGSDRTSSAPRPNRLPFAKQRA